MGLKRLLVSPSMLVEVLKAPASKIVLSAVNPLPADTTVHLFEWATEGEILSVVLRSAEWPEDGPLLDVAPTPYLVRHHDEEAALIEGVIAYA